MRGSEITSDQKIPIAWEKEKEKRLNPPNLVDDAEERYQRRKEELFQLGCWTCFFEQDCTKVMVRVEVGEEETDELKVCLYDMLKGIPCEINFHRVQDY